VLFWLSLYAPLCRSRCFGVHVNFLRRLSCGIVIAISNDCVSKRNFVFLGFYIIMKKKLIMGLGSILLLFAVGGAITVWNLESLTNNEKNVERALNEHHDYLWAVTNLLTAQAELYRYQAGYAGNAADLKSSVDNLNNDVSHLMTDTSDESQKASLKEVLSLLDEYKQKVSLTLINEELEVRLKLEKEASELGDRVKERLLGLYAVSQAETDQLTPIMERIVSLSKLVIYLTLFFSGTLAIAGSVWLIKGITDSVNRLIDGTNALSAGDFAQRIDITSDDELGVLSERFNQMAEAISKREQEVKGTMEELESTNEELRASYGQMEALTYDLEYAKNELEVEHRRLVESKEYLQSVLEDSPDVIVTTDTEGNIVEFNKGAEEILRYTRKELIGTPVELLYQDEVERREILKIVEEKGRATNYEARLKTRDGKILDVSLTISLLRDGIGNVVGTVGISRDITEIKKKREELLSLYKALQETTLALEAARADLEKKVEERTSELREANEKLIDSNIKIKEGDRLKSEFMANMSHELRTPLNAVIGFSEVLLDGIDGEISDVQKIDVTHIHDSGVHLLEIINDILDLSKIEAGKMELMREEVDLNAVIAGVAPVARTLIKGKDIIFMTQIDENLPTIIADSKRLKQIILNLLSNAAKFTEEGEIVIKAGPAEDGYFVISVRDTGIGIKGEDMPKVFEKFRQIDMSSTRNKGGTGLGMAITKRLVEMHGGTIALDSRVGAGTTFSVKLPLIYDGYKV